jgi:hypothetical protein
MEMGQELLCSPWVDGLDGEAGWAIHPSHEFGRTIPYLWDANQGH